jgi:hypothetical protein
VLLFEEVELGEGGRVGAVEGVRGGEGEDLAVLLLHHLHEQHVLGSAHEDGVAPLVGSQHWLLGLGDVAVAANRLGAHLRLME